MTGGVLQATCPEGAIPIGPLCAPPQVLGGVLCPGSGKVGALPIDTVLITEASPTEGARRVVGDPLLA